MAMITVKHLTFQYESIDDPLFQDVSFSIDTNWNCGLIGNNGNGKTTLLNLLCKKLSGTGTVDCPVPVEIFPYAIADPSRVTTDVLEDVSGAQPWQIQKECARLELRSDLLWQPFETLSQGEKIRCMLAALFLKEGAFVLLDEPSNHLDEKGKQILGAYLKSKRGFLLVSHDRKLLDDCVDHVVALTPQGVDVRKGNFSAWHLDHENMLAKDRAENERLRHEIKRLEASARMAGSWSNAKEKQKIGAADKGFVGHKAAKLMKRSKAIEARKEKAVEEKRKLIKSDEQPETLRIQTRDYKKSTLMHLTRVRVVYETWSTPSQTFSIGQGERIRLCGANGSGKSSLLKAIVGQCPYEGTIEASADLTVSYVAQTVEEAQGSIERYIARYAIDRTLFMTILRKFGFSRAELTHPLEALSAGQRRKIMLARSLCESAHLYVWDEPLNDLDIDSREQIEHMLQESGYTMLFVEHDTMFSQSVATKEIDFDEKTNEEVHIQKTM